MTPTLSIITINYNNKDGLKKTIESVVTQTETGFEYIIIDGASTDGSAELIKEYAEHPEYGKKITYWVSEPDSGIYNAMNKGIGKANGEYLHMLNSGDWYEKDALSHILPKLKEEKPDLLLCMLNLWNKGAKLQSVIKYKSYLNEGPLSHQGIIYSKRLHKNYGLYNEAYKYASDYDFFVTALLHKNRKYSYFFTPKINFLLDGVGSSTASHNEIKLIQLKNGIRKKHQKNIFFIFKQFIKFFVPYGLLIILKKIRNK